MVPEAGYWLLPDELNDKEEEGSVGVFSCPKGACLQGGVCSAGRGGLLCSQCLAGYASAGSTCTRCGQLNTFAARMASLGLVSALLMLLWYIGAWKPYLQCRQRDAQGEGAEDAERKRPCTSGWASWLWSKIQLFRDSLKKKRFVDGRAPIRDYAKIVIGYYQIVSNFDTTYSVQWQPAVTRIWQYASILRADVFAVPGVSCLASNLSYHTILIICALFPLFIAFLFAIPSLILVLRRQTSSHRFKQVQDQATQTLMFFLFVTYPFLSYVAVQGFFNCRQVGSENYFARDMSVLCPYDHKTGSIFIWSIIATVLYPIGVPCLILFVLHWFRIPAMARKKADDALLRALIVVYKQASALADTQHVVNQLQGNTSASNTPLGTPLGSKGEKLAKILAALDSDARRSVDWPTFQTVLQSAVESNALFSGEESTDKIDLKQLQTLFEFPFEDCLPRQPPGLLASRRSQQSGSQSGSVTGADRSGTFFDRSASWSAEKAARRLERVELQAEARAALLARVLQVGKDLHQKGLISLPVLRWDEATEEERDAIDRVGFLFDSYKVEAWWFELAEMARKFVMSALVVYFYQGTPQQVMSGLFVTATYLFGFLKIAPYSSNHLETLQGLSLTAQSITLLYGLLLAVHSLQDVPIWGREEVRFRYLVLVVNVAMFLMPLLLLLPERIGWRKLLQKCRSPQQRRCRSEEELSTHSISSASDQQPKKDSFLCLQPPVPLRGSSEDVHAATLGAVDSRIANVAAAGVGLATSRGSGSVPTTSDADSAGSPEDTLCANRDQAGQQPAEAPTPQVEAEANEGSEPAHASGTDLEAPSLSPSKEARTSQAGRRDLVVVAASPPAQVGAAAGEARAGPANLELHAAAAAAVGGGSAGSAGRGHAVLGGAPSTLATLDAAGLELPQAEQARAEPASRRACSPVPEALSEAVREDQAEEWSGLSSARLEQLQLVTARAAGRGDVNPWAQARARRGLGFDDLEVALPPGGEEAEPALTPQPSPEVKPGGSGLVQLFQHMYGMCGRVDLRKAHRAGGEIPVQMSARQGGFTWRPRADPESEPSLRSSPSASLRAHGPLTSSGAASRAEV